MADDSNTKGMPWEKYDLSDIDFADSFSRGNIDFIDSHYDGDIDFTDKRTDVESAGFTDLSFLDDIPSAGAAAEDFDAGEWASEEARIRSERMAAARQTREAVSALGVKTRGRPNPARQIREAVSSLGIRLDSHPTPEKQTRAALKAVGETVSELRAQEAAESPFAEELREGRGADRSFTSQIRGADRAFASEIRTGSASDGSRELAHNISQRSRWEGKGPAPAPSGSPKSAAFSQSIGESIIRVRAEADYARKRQERSSSTGSKGRFGKLWGIVAVIVMLIASNAEDLSSLFGRESHSTPEVVLPENPIEFDTPEEEPFTEGGDDNDAEYGDQGDAYYEDYLTLSAEDEAAWQKVFSTLMRMRTEGEVNFETCTWEELEAYFNHHDWQYATDTTSDDPDAYVVYAAREITQDSSVWMYVTPSDLWYQLSQMTDEKVDPGDIRAALSGADPEAVSYLGQDAEDNGITYELLSSLVAASQEEDLYGETEEPADSEDSFVSYGAFGEELTVYLAMDNPSALEEGGYLRIEINDDQGNWCGLELSGPDRTVYCIVSGGTLNYLELPEEE